MRVMQVMAGAPHGGAEAFFERLATALQDAGLDQRVVIRRDAARAARLRAGGVDPHQLAFGGGLDVRTRPGMRREVASWRPDVVLSWMSRATDFVPAGGFRRAHPFVHVGRLGGHYPLKHFQNCDWLIANTEGVAGYLRACGWPSRRTRVIPNFVEAADVPARARAAEGTPDGVPLVLAMGRLHANKGFDVLIRALAKAPEAWLWLAGAGPEEGALRHLAEEAGVAARVRFLGWRDNVAELYRAADLYVCSSRIEPLGNVVLEAWAHGVPVIAARAAGPAELIAEGDSGLLVPVDDADALGAAIAQLAADRALAVRLAEGGRAAHGNGFTRAAVVAAYMDFFREVAG